jgi:hypothetical protein
VRERTYRVWFIRYGVQLYYPADTLGEAQRFIRVWKAVGGIDLQSLEFPDGTKIDV